MGKTALATNLTHDIASKGTPVAYFSLEMSGEQITTRIIAERAAVSLERARQGTLDEDELYRFGKAAAEVLAMPLFIEEAGGISIAQLCIRARRKKRKHNIEALFV
jgi:replicative DNA helicase